MKSIRLFLALIVAAFAFSNLARAEDTKPATGKPGKCCEKAVTEGKACTHGCCAAAAKESKNCEKCGGKNEPKTETSM